jgi:cytosine/creatinine deaminase
MLIIPSWSSSSTHDLINAPLLLREVSLADGRVANVLTADGTIVAVAEDEPSYPASAEVLNLRGYLLLPSFTEPHATLGQALPAADPAARMWTAAMSHLVNGTTAIRAHVDVTEREGLEALQTLLDLRASLAGVMDIQIVAVTLAPVAGPAGARHRGFLRYALALGADLAGGAPGLHDPDRTVESLAVTAADAGAGLDLDVGETPDLAVRTLSRMLVISQVGFGNPVTASNVTSLAISPQRRPALLRSLARAGIGAVTLPKARPARPGPGAGASPDRGLAGVRHLLHAGMTVAAGGGGKQDPASPPGRGDPLAAASLLATAGRLTPAAALAAVTSAGRHIMRLPEVVIAPGFPADLVAVRAADLREAMAIRAPDRIVVRGGRVVARARAGTDTALPEFHAMRPVWN